jgi:two-component system cell cycle sensor histidine kinase/response regulator CckA
MPLKPLLDFVNARRFGQSAAPAPVIKPVRVLIVDDEESVLRFVDRVLRDSGFETLLAGDGDTAITIAATASEHIDLLLTDFMMPQMNGDEVARQLRSANPNLKVLYLTGFSDQLFKERAVLWENEVFLDKPCSIAGLRQAVSLLLFGVLEPRALPSKRCAS